MDLNDSYYDLEVQPHSCSGREHLSGLPDQHKSTEPSGDRTSITDQSDFRTVEEFVVYNNEEPKKGDILLNGNLGISEYVLNNLNNGDTIHNSNTTPREHIAEIQAENNVENGNNAKITDTILVSADTRDQGFCESSHEENIAAGNENLANTRRYIKLLSSLKDNEEKAEMLSILQKYCIRRPGGM